MPSCYWRRRKKKSKGKTSKSSDKGWITVGYIPDEMPEILLTLIKTWGFISGFCAKRKVSLWWAELEGVDSWKLYGNGITIIEARIYESSFNILDWR